MRLLLDAMFGTLATYLRMCGHDAAYAPDRGLEDDDAILAVARAEGRTLVTRDERLARRCERALFVEAHDVRDQLRELRATGVELRLADPPVRCSACNGRLGRVSPDAEVPDYAPAPAETDCWRCRDCGQVFWKGSHWDDVRRRLDAL